MVPLMKHPRFAEAFSTFNEMAAALAKVQTRIAELSVLLSGSQDLRGERESGHVAAALEFASTGKVSRSGALDVEGMTEEHALLRRQAEALQTALVAQQKTMGLVSSELTAEASRTLAPRHKDIAARALVALQALDAIVDEEAELIATAERLGYSPSFIEYVHWPYLGRLKQGSEAAIYHRVRSLQTYVR